MKNTPKVKRKNCPKPKPIPTLPRNIPPAEDALPRNIPPPEMALPRNIPLHHEPKVLEKEKSYLQRQFLESDVIATLPKQLSSYPSNTGVLHGTSGEKIRYVGTFVPTGTSLRNVGTPQGDPGLNKLARVSKCSDTVIHHQPQVESRRLQPDLKTTTTISSSKESELQGNVAAHFSEPKRVTKSVSELANIFGTKLNSRRVPGRQPGKMTGKENTSGRQPQIEDSNGQLKSDFKLDKKEPVKFGNKLGLLIQNSDQNMTMTGRQPVLEQCLEHGRQPEVQNELLHDKLDSTAAAQLHYRKENPASQNKPPSNSEARKETFAPIDCFTTPTVRQ